MFFYSSLSINKSFDWLIFTSLILDMNIDRTSIYVGIKCLYVSILVIKKEFILTNISLIVDL